MTSLESNGDSLLCYHLQGSFVYLSHGLHSLSYGIFAVLLHPQLQKAYHESGQSRGPDG